MEIESTTYRKGLVSIITPCYNGAHLIPRLLDSILMQDYPNVEMFVIDDGSTDNTREVVLGYEARFAEKGYALHYIYQANGGQASALNNGLKHVTGEYLLWPDADDYYHSPHAVSSMVEAFGQLDDSYAIVRCEGQFVDERTLQPVRQRTYNQQKEHIFEEYFTGQESIAVAGLTMVRMAAFDKVNPKREIFHGRMPQNFQMMLPLGYSYKHYTLHENLYSILLKHDSHSRQQVPYEKCIDTFEGYQEITDKTLDSIAAIPAGELAEYHRLSRLSFLEGAMVMSFKYAKPREANRYASEKAAMGAHLTTACQIRRVLVWCPPALRVFDWVVNRLRSNA